MLRGGSHSRWRIWRAAALVVRCRLGVESSFVLVGRLFVRVLLRGVLFFREMLVDYIVGIMRQLLCRTSLG